MKEFIKKNRNIFILIFFTLIISIPLFNIEALNGHDTVFHLFRNNSTLNAIKDGQLIPMVDPNMMGGFGYAPNMFYGVLSTYVVTLFNLVLPLGLSLNLFYILTIFLSGLFMYYFVKKISKNDFTALIAALLYMIFPYHLLDIFGRGAGGEILSFVFIPLLFHGLYDIINQNYKSWYLISIALAGLLLTNNICSFMSTLFGFIYLLINIKKIWNKKAVIALVKSLIFAVLIGLVTIIPLLITKTTSDYMVFDPTYMRTTSESMMLRALNLFNWSKNGFYNLLNAITILSIFLVIFTFIFNLKEKNKTLFQFILLSAIATILTINIIPWNLLPGIFSSIQFPWRYLQFSSFFLCIPLAFIINKICHKNIIKIIIVIILSLLTISFSIICLIYNDGFLSNNLINKNELKYRKNVARSTGVASSEYLPRKVIYNYQYLKDHSMLPLDINETSNITNIKKDGTKLTFNIEVLKNTTIELPYIYYSGYIVKVNNKEINNFETKNGLVGFNLNQGIYKISSRYRGTKTMIASYIISIASTITLIIIVVREKKVKN